MGGESGLGAAEASRVTPRGCEDTVKTAGCSTVSLARAILPCPTVPEPTLPYPTVPEPTLPYPTVPEPTLPYCREDGQSRGSVGCAGRAMRWSGDAFALRP